MRILSNIYRRANAYPSKTLSKRVPAEKGTLSNSFYEATITLMLKSDKDNTKIENYKPISLMNTDVKIFNKIFANNLATHQKVRTPRSSWVYSRDTRILQYMQTDQCDIPY